MKTGTGLYTHSNADYLELVYFVTALVPSETACLANSPGNNSLTAVWISREVMVDLLQWTIDNTIEFISLTSYCNEQVC